MEKQWDHVATVLRPKISCAANPMNPHIFVGSYELFWQLVMNGGEDLRVGVTIVPCQHTARPDFADPGSDICAHRLVSVIGIDEHQGARAIPNSRRCVQGSSLPDLHEFQDASQAHIPLEEWPDRTAKRLGACDHGRFIGAASKGIDGQHL
jgi:hypothetical protein